MKVLHVINSLAGGGRERRMVQLVYGLTSKGDFHQNIIVFSNRNDYYDKNKSNATIHVVTNSSKLIRLIKYTRLFVQIKPQIVHIWLETPFELLVIPLLCYLFRIKCIAGFVADGNTYKKTSVISIVSRICFKLSDAIVSNSKAGLAAKRVPENKGYVIYNGFDFSRFDNTDGKALRIKENINTNYVVTMCARFTAAKDWNMFVNLAQLSQNEDVTFLAVGDGLTFNLIKKEIEDYKLDNIRLMGRRKDVENILDASDISVLFSNDNKHKEGISNSILEAMAAGRPVIATIGGGTNEIVEEDITGFLVKPGDVDDAYGKMKNLLANDKIRIEMGNNAKIEVKKKFLLSEMTQHYINLYFNLVQ